MRSYPRRFQQMLGNINAAGAAGQSTFQRFGGSLKEAFSTYTMANMLQDGIYKVVDAGKQGLETVKSFNDIKTDLATPIWLRLISMLKRLRN